VHDPGEPRSQQASNVSLSRRATFLVRGDVSFVAITGHSYRWSDTAELTLEVSWSGDWN